MWGRGAAAQPGVWPGRGPRPMCGPGTGKGRSERPFRLRFQPSATDPRGCWSGRGAGIDVTELSRSALKRGMDRARGDRRGRHRAGAVGWLDCRSVSDGGPTVVRWCRCRVAEGGCGSVMSVSAPSCCWSGATAFTRCPAASGSVRLVQAVAVAGASGVWAGAPVCGPSGRSVMPWPCRCSRRGHAVLRWCRCASFGALPSCRGDPDRRSPAQSRLLRRRTLRDPIAREGKPIRRAGAVVLGTRPVGQSARGLS